MKHSPISKNKGQALIIIMILIAISTIILTETIQIMGSNTIGGTSLQEGNIAHQIAESGIENTLLLLLRNPYYSGETLPVGEGTANVSVTTNNNIKTITSIGMINNFQRKITVNISYNNYVIRIIDWKDSL
ncbi:MAG: hypothetical protein Q7R95_05170 [bacterium]|nr:hypothetical protein [bacterium]